MQRLGVLLKLLRILRFVKDYIVGHAAGRWSLFTAFLGRRMSELRRSWNRKPGTSQNPRTAEPLLPGNGPRSFATASGGSAVLRGYVVAASTVPGHLASFQEDARQSPRLQPSPSPTTSTSIPANLSADQPHPLYGRNRTASSSGNLSVSSAQSRANERLSTIINSRELLHVPVDRPSQPPRGIYRQFGPDVDPSASRGQLARSPSPTYRQNITRSDSHLAITTIHSHAHDADGGGSPVASPLSSSSMHGPLIPLTNCNMWSRPSTGIKLSIQAPSTDSLPLVRTTLTEESMATDHRAHSTPFSAMGQSETASQHSTIAPSATSDHLLPEGRFLHLINSDRLLRSRYDNVTM
jgi:hypothetical protein